MLVLGIVEAWRDPMKRKESKTRKHRETSGMKHKPACGTISYMAECRGMSYKKDVSPWTAPPDGASRIVRKYPAV
jgi:hypothetical protein